MNLFLARLIIYALFLSGCSLKDGVSVRVKPKSSSVFKRDMETFLCSKGFQARAACELEGFVLEFRPRTENVSRVRLHALYHEFDGVPRFFIGKGNSNSFTDQEREVIAECIDFLVQRADAIESGFASRAAATKSARANFYAVIKEL